MSTASVLLSPIGRRSLSKMLTVGFLALVMVTSGDTWVKEHAVAAAPSKPACPESAEAGGAALTAKLCDGRVHIPGLTTETTTVDALPNGTYEATVSDGPARVRQADGTWVPVDLTLVKNADGSISPKAHPRGLRISGAAGAGAHELAAAGLGDDRVAMGWSGQLPEPTLDGNAAVYIDVRPGVNLVVEATRLGFEQKLVVKDATGLAQVRNLTLPLTAKAASSYTRDSHGNMALTASNGRVIAQVPAPLMWDAAANLDKPGAGDNGLTPVTTSVAKRSATKTASGGVDLTLTPDAAWLGSAERKFPIVIDPTINPFYT